MKGHLTDIHGPDGPDNVWPDMWTHVSDAAKSKAKQKWAVEKPKLDNAILFIDLEDEIFLNVP